MFLKLNTIITMNLKEKIFWRKREKERDIRYQKKSLLLAEVESYIIKLSQWLQIDLGKFRKLDKFHWWGLLFDEIKKRIEFLTERAFKAKELEERNRELEEQIELLNRELVNLREQNKELFEKLKKLSINKK